MRRAPFSPLYMLPWTRLFGALSCAIGTALLALAAPPPAHAASAGPARTISNIAQIEWDQGGRHLRQASNEVDIAIDVRDSVTGPSPVDVVPIDKIGAPLEISMTTTTSEAAPGDTIDYSVGVRNPDPRVVTTPIVLTDRFPGTMRLRAGTLRVNGRPAVARMAQDGRSFDFDVPALAPGAAARISFAMEVLGTAVSGETVNRIEVKDENGAVGSAAAAVVRIRRDALHEDGGAIREHA